MTLRFVNLERKASKITNFENQNFTVKKHLIYICLLLATLTACLPQTGQNPSATDDSTGLDMALNDTLDDGAEQPGIVRTDSTKPDSGIRQYIEGAFTVPAAMEVIYGLYDKNIECSKWLCKPHEARRFESKASDDGLLHTRAAGAYPFDAKDGRRMLLLTETLSREKEDWEGCHACAPILGAAMFQEIDGAWFIEALQKDLGEIGSYGELPSNKLVSIGPEMVGVLFNEGYTAQGITEGGIVLIGLIEGKFEVLIDQNTSFSNEGMFVDPKTEPRAYSYSSELNFETDEPGKPFTLVLQRKGRCPKDGKEGTGPIVNISETLRYRIVGTRYVLVGE